MAKLPTFIVIGAARSGTTALYNFLRQHPGIYMSPIKEPNYFAFDEGPVRFEGPGAEFVNNSVRELSAYERLFEGAPDGCAIGEASPLYLYCPRAPERMSRLLPEARLVAILRNPVEQAYSHYLYARAQMIEPLEDFTAALHAQESRQRKHWQPLFQYADFPRYGAQLGRYYRHFARSKIRVFLYEEFESDPLAVLRDIHAFIGVDDSFQTVTTHRANQGGVPRSPLLQSLVMRPNPVSRLVGSLLPDKWRRLVKDKISSGNIQRQKMPTEARRLLVERLGDDIRVLSALLDRDLSAWLQEPAAAS